MKPIDRSILESDNILEIAQFLLGKFLISQINGNKCVTKIVETEAYKAPEDKGSHAYNNKRTKRTEVMFHRGGISYVYLCYGIHNMLNVVTAAEGQAHAILVRAVEPISGVDYIKKRRGTTGNQLTNGPGKVCQALGITREHNGINLWDTKSLVYICENKLVPNENILTGPRVGIAYAQECAHWPWRFRIRNNPWTSKPDEVVY